MIVSTKGRYALRVMVYFVLHGSEGYIPLKQIAEAEGISQKYLEAIMTTLSKAGFVDAVHGKGPLGVHRGQHSEADGGQPCHRILHHPGRICLQPCHLLPYPAHVGKAGRHGGKLF